MSKSKYYQALRTEHLNHQIKAAEYELIHYEFNSSDDYWLECSGKSYQQSWAISDAIDNIFGKKYRENAKDNELNADLLRQWVTIFLQIEDAKKQAA